MKRVFATAIFLLLLAIPASAELDVICVNFPLYDFACHVAGEAADVTMLVAPGTEVHAYDPTPKDMIAVQQCDILLYVGGESDGWVDSILEAAEAPAALRLMDCVEALEEDHGEDGEHHEHEHHEHEGEDETELDEHIWTSPVNAIRMVEAIAEAFAGIDPENADLYRGNAEDYVAELTALDGQFRNVIEGASRKLVIFADRFPMAYFAHEYGLDYIAAFPGCSAETEPSAKVMKKLIDAVRADGIPCVYTIEMSDGRVAETVREETGCEILTMHSCQNITKDEMEAGETYLSLMQKNVSALEKGLR